MSQQGSSAAIDDGGSDPPQDRASVTRRKTATAQVSRMVLMSLFVSIVDNVLVQRPQRFKEGARLWQKNAFGHPQHQVTIVSCRYDDAKHEWMYVLKDVHGMRIGGETAEDDLVR